MVVHFSRSLRLTPIAEFHLCPCMHLGTLPITAMLFCSYYTIYTIANPYGRCARLQVPSVALAPKSTSPAKIPSCTIRPTKEEVRGRSRGVMFAHDSPRIKRVTALP